ncbi:hypothetical protein ACP70R_047102 [Stipagrostis hirtigluma subsp. patula]
MAAAMISAAFSVVLKALGPVADPVLEAWAATKHLGPNMEALKMELLCVRAMLEPLTGREVHNPALEVLLQKLQDHAYDADDVLDELDYFRLQDQLDGSVEAVDEHPKGCAHNLILNARHTAKAVGKMLCVPPCSSASGSTGVGHQADGEASGRMLTHAFGSYNPFRTISKCLPCSSLPPVRDDDDNNDPCHSGVRNTTLQREHASETPKLGFDRVNISTRMKDIAEQLQAMRLNVSQILTTLGSNWSTTPNIAKSRPLTTPGIIEEKLYGRDDVINTIIHDITKGKYVGKDLTVLPIIGPGGIGKTTLTQQIYRSQKVQEHFQIKIWTCVSVNFNVNKLLEEIEQHTPKVDDEKTEFEKLFLAYKIMDKLKGSSLAAKTVARLLRNNLDLDHWNKVLESKEWESQGEENEIMPALKLSYDYLPFHLQQCFVYCALFPQDYNFGRSELLNFWIGLDILQSVDHRRKPEEIGAKNLQDLISHGFLKKDKTNNCYLIHDLLHDLALKVSSRECLAINQSDMRSTEIQPSTRHLSIIIDDADDNDGISSENFATELRKLKMRLNIQNLRTLMMFGKFGKGWLNALYDFIRDANALRVLHLHDYSFHEESMPQLLLPTLVHLRYLRLRTYCTVWCIHTGPRELHVPRAISRCYHLRILDLETWDGSLVLPSDMSNLTKLFHFLTKYDEGHSCISNVGKLQFLKELKFFSVNKDNSGHGGPSCPTWLRDKLSVKALKSLCLDGVAWKDLPLLGHMWALQELELKNMSTVKELHTSHFGSITEHSFCSLKKLKLISLRELEKCFIGDACRIFSELEVLIIVDCPKLLRLPLEESNCHPPTEDQGGNIHWFPKLLEFKIINCENVKSFPLVPWTRTLRSVKIEDSMLISSLDYSKSDSNVTLRIDGSDNLHNLDGLVFDNLTDLQELLRCCPMFLSAYETSPLSSCSIFPSSLQQLDLHDAGRMQTLEPLSNLTSLTRLFLSQCGEDLISEGLWPLVIQGHLSELCILGSPKFFAASYAMWGWLNGDREQLLRRHSKLQQVKTDDVTGFLTVPICTVLSTSLTQLRIGSEELVGFTEAEEEALQLLTSLQTLDCLPAGLCKLPNLKSLQISGCPAISSLPKDGLPNSLRQLDVQLGGDELKQQCRNFILDHPGIELII